MDQSGPKRGGAMTAFLIENIAPLMFGALAAGTLNFAPGGCGFAETV